jgi:CubicO group peptidase (beta-lactamase class C family)
MAADPGRAGDLQAGNGGLAQRPPGLPLRLWRAAAARPDLAKFGYLYLNRGRWDGTQVVPADHVAASTRPQSYPSGGLGDYGYQWWVTHQTAGHDGFRAQGYGGQVIQVIPDLDLVVVITSDPDQQGFDAANLVGVIVPAVTG